MRPTRTNHGALRASACSQTTPAVAFTEAEKQVLTEKIQNAGTVVVEAKAGKGSATLSMAYAAARMTESVLLGLNGEPNIFECAYVESDVVPEVAYFATKVCADVDGGTTFRHSCGTSIWRYLTWGGT